MKKIRESKEIEENKRSNINKKNKNSKHSKSKKPKIVMTERKKKFRRKLNNLFVLAYLVFSIYTIACYFSWKSLIVPMMKNESSIIVDQNGNLIEKLGAERKKK